MLGRFSCSLSYSWSCSLNSSFVFTWVACPWTFFEKLLPTRPKLHNCCYCTIAFISHAGKVVLKILQARLQQHMNWELQDVQAGFRKGRGTRDQIADIRWIIEKGNSRKTSTSALLNMPANLEHSGVATGLELSVFIPILKKDNAKECSNYLKLLSSHTLAKKCSNFSKPGSNSVWTKNFLPNVQAGFRKGIETRDQTANIFWIIEKVREFQKKKWFVLHWLC